MEAEPESIAVLVANYVWHQCLRLNLCLTPSQMRITTRRLDLCLALMIHDWHQCFGTKGKGARKVLLFFSQIMSGTSDLCLTPSQMRITTRRLDLCLALMIHDWHQCFMSDTNDPCLEPMEAEPENITVLVANYVWHQCFMSDTNDPCLEPMEKGPSDLSLAPVFYVWHQ
ncbi:hypothetical protein [Phoenicibacter congonensis]|uniref:hypothetical protein n=1 Tax=Phoenicibacter congonensis TaxID=1944646 RepID=UPI0011C9E4A2|nr:hypothetical protein [Phoenicibacter congonensis]